MSNAGNHCRTGASSSSLVKLGFLSAQRDGRFRSFWGGGGIGGVVLLNCLDGYVLMDMSCKIKGCFFFKLAVVFEGFSITSLSHNAFFNIVNSSIFSFI